jgi:hypothetical protein
VRTVGFFTDGHGRAALAARSGLMRAAESAESAVRDLNPEPAD